ncbi:hypothetical protein HPB50_007619 [Hyalomma asiaticum]|uniref:Uncharacterized protein n=1 Tax=Hyalomma asiaticum TaxID=266040 RepID=A0ACB7SIT2_HYAAI|nr:hypothetical protein HPB50_007619 [Hyalomma asiaticum]
MHSIASGTLGVQGSAVDVREEEKGTSPEDNHLGKKPTYVQNSHFVELVSSLSISDNECLMSFSVLSLFMSVPEELAVATAHTALEGDANLEARTSLNVDELCRLLDFCLKSTYFSDSGVYYKHLTGTAVGAPVLVATVNLIMEAVEDRVLQSAGITLKIFLRYVNDCFCWELNQLDEKLVRLLAWQRLQQLLPVNGSAVMASEVQARAMVCPVGNKGSPVPMPYRTLTLGSGNADGPPDLNISLLKAVCFVYGTWYKVKQSTIQNCFKKAGFVRQDQPPPPNDSETGADMDVCLRDFGHCDFVSAKHACIFYDEIGKHYELLNYSEHGTTVDNVLYSCDFSDKRLATSTPAALAAPRPGSRRTCGCRANPIGAAGWEGTALLHHGSLIKLGCLQFVFSVTNHHHIS